MGKYSKLLVIPLFVIAIVLSYVVIVLQYKEIGDYKKSVMALLKDKAETEGKVNSLKQLKIYTSNPGSVHVKIGDIIYEYANKINGSVSIYYKNLATGESVLVDEDNKYYMASLYKVILTLFILDQIKSEKISLTDKVGSPPLVLSTALKKIISESNNEYALALANDYSWKAIESYTKQKVGVGFSLDKNLETNVGNIGLLFEHIALSVEMTDGQSGYLLDLLNQQTRRSKLPKYLPEHIYTHNKTGEYDGYSHDAAIIYTPKANYVLVFMSKSVIPADTNEKMAQMSKSIYDILNDISVKK